MFLKLKPKIIQTDTMTVFPNDEYEQVKLKYCPKHKDNHGGCPFWNDGEGSTDCVGCPMASWEVVGE